MNLTFDFLLVCSLWNIIVKSGHALNMNNPRQMLINMGTSYNKPEQIHLAFGSTPSDIVVLWSSASNESCLVEYSSNPQNIKSTIARSAELKRDFEKAKKFVYRAELKNLLPGTRYSYRIKSGPSGVKSNVFFFSVPRNDRKKPQTFMMLADMGLRTESLQFVVHEAINGKYDAVFHIGDFAYNLNTDRGSVGDKFMNKIQPFTSVVPYMPTPGDHEMFSNYYHYGHRFSTPGVKWPMQENNLWYSFDIELVHFISINTDGLLRGEYKKEQLAWLKNDLIKATSGRKQHPWIIVMGHKPVYCSKSVMEQECDKEFSGLRESLEDLLYEYGVDLYISGHKHCYERTWPMYKGKVFQKSYVDPTAPTYIVIGALGYEYLLDGQFSKPQWLAASMSERGKELFGRLKVLNSTHLEWSVHAASNNEQVDNIQFIRSHHKTYGTPGENALDELKEKQFGSQADLPPEPFKIIDVPLKDVSYYTGISRKVLLSAGVFALSFITFLFLRHSRVRKVLKI